jgi:hypothetical protein
LDFQALKIEKSRMQHNFALVFTLASRGIQCGVSSCHYSVWCNLFWLHGIKKGIPSHFIFEGYGYHSCNSKYYLFPRSYLFIFQSIKMSCSLTFWPESFQESGLQISLSQTKLRKLFSQLPNNYSTYIWSHTPQFCGAARPWAIWYCCKLSSS